MEIKVSEIPAEGLSVELTEEAGTFGDLGEELKVLDAVKARFQIRKAGDTVFLSGETDARFELSCSRCGKAFVYEAGAGFELEMDPLEAAAGEEEKELSPEELEVEFYKGGTIDLSELVREQVILQAPMKPLCREDCKGLCQYCGQDLNEGRCDCTGPTGHPGLAGLKDLLKDKK